MAKFDFDSLPDATDAPAFNFDELPDAEPAKQDDGRPWYSLEAKNLIPGALAGLQKIDEYTGAPIRKFVTEKLSGQEMEKAPTGAEQAKMLGATDQSYGDYFNAPDWVPGRDISPADVYGVGLEVVQDPFVIGAGIKKAASGITKGAASAIDSLKGMTQSTKAVQSQVGEAAAESSAKSGAAFSGGGIEVEQGGKLFDYKAPQTLEELRQWKPEAGAGEMLGKTRLQEIEKTIPDLKTKPLKYHYDMMENPKAMKELKLTFENLPTDDAKKIAAYNQEIVEESGRKVRQTIEGISGYEPKSLSDAGENFIGAVKTKYNAEKDALGPVFEQLKKGASRVSDAEAKDLVIAISENSKVGKLLQQDEAGRFVLGKNTPRSGVSDAEHNVIARVIDDLNDGISFEEIQKTRDFLRKQIDPMNPGASEEVSKVRSILLGQLEAIASTKGESVGKTFKAYAINERARESIEKVIGGRIESLDAMFAANPDKVVQKIFSNPNYVKVVGDYVGPEAMQDMIAAYVNNGVKKSFDSAKGFNPVALRGWLKTNSGFLNAHVSPEVTSRLNALADYGYYGKRFLDEVNPSGTAASLISAIEPQNFIQRVKSQGVTGALQAQVANKVDVSLKQRQATKSLQEALGGMDPKLQDHFMKKLMQGTPGAVESAATFQKSGAALRGIIQESKIPRSANEDKEGTAKTFDKSFDKGALLQKAQGSKYGQVLQNAAQNGDQSMAAAHYVLHSQDESYRKLMEGK